MRTESAWVLLALPALLAWVWWLSRRSYAQLSPRARWGSAAVRAVLLLCLVAALARPAWQRHTRGQHLIFLLDASRSVGRENLQAALDEIDRLGREARAQDGAHRVSVIAFGRRPRLLTEEPRCWSGWGKGVRELALYESEIPALHAERARLIGEAGPADSLKSLDDRIARLEEFRAQVAGDHTDAQGAVRLALACGGTEEAKTLYLLTDANFTRGDWREAFDAAAARGHPIHTVALDRPLPPEVAATDLVLPRTVRINEGFSADLRIVSTADVKASIAVFRDGYAVAEVARQLKPGENTVQIPGLFFRDKGFHTVEAAVRAEHDTKVENNTARALVIVPGELRVLYIDSDEAQQSYLASALGLEGIQVESRPVSGVPQSLAGLLGFDALILSNVPADRLSAPQMQAIKAYVQDFGGGFLMLGGDQSFGLGGYYGTPVEEVLPVRMPIQKDMNRPSLAIVLVIDKSGSMEGVKIQLAKRAALATAEVINPRDQIGVVGFDSEAQVLLELTSAGDRGTITDAVSSLDAGGGTFLYPAMELAHTQLQQSNARRKHIIVLSDGQTQGFGYADFAQMLAAEGITVSTVGIGEGADMRLLEEMASAGTGRAYFTNDFYSIPQIFTREALRASNSMLVERLVQPSIATPDPAIDELDAAELPPLAGYVATTPKETGKVILVSDSGDPILAVWRSGLGRSAAFTSDTKPRWAQDWIRWPDFAKFWAQLVRSIAGREVAADVSVEASSETRAEEVRLTADIRTAVGDFVTDRSVELTAYDPASGTRAIAVQGEAPGLFSATVPLGAYGRVQQFAWHLKGRAGDLVSPFGFVESFSPEFRSLGPDAVTLAEIRSRGAGTVASVGASVLKLDQRTSAERIALWPALLALALLLAPLDILVRRMG